MNKGLEEKYTKIAQIYYEKKFNEEILVYYSDLIKKEAESIAKKMIKQLKKEELKSLIEKELENNNNFKNRFKEN